MEGRRDVIPDGHDPVGCRDGIVDPTFGVDVAARVGLQIPVHHLVAGAHGACGLIALKGTSALLRSLDHGDTRPRGRL